jgi:CubicO group peptidase (beta-lactamase class C family)
VGAAVGAALVSAASTAGAQGRAQGRTHTSGSVHAEVDSIFAPYTGDTVPGAAVLVAVDGAVQLARGYGMADLEARVPVTSRTSFRLASVSKQMTAMAVLALVEDGRLSLHATLGEVLPGVPAYARDVRVDQLLSHTSGIPDYEPILGKGDGPQVKDRDVLTLLGSRQRLYFRPGTRWRYSNSGYALLALIVEQVTRERFAEYLAHRVFARAGMTGAVAHEEGIDTVPHRAFGYSRRGGGWRRSDQSRTSAVLGDGGVYASVEELARWSDALDRNAIVSAETFTRATTPATIPSGEPTHTAPVAALADRVADLFLGQ